mgnify:CR=1 FL=1
MTIKTIKQDGKTTKFKEGFKLVQVKGGSIVIPKKNIKKLNAIEKKEKIKLL